MTAVPEKTNLKMADQTRAKLLGKVEVNLEIGEEPMRVSIFVVQGVGKGILIGLDILSTHPEWKIALERLYEITKKVTDTSNSQHTQHSSSCTQINSPSQKQVLSTKIDAETQTDYYTNTTETETQTEATPLQSPENLTTDCEDINQEIQCQLVQNEPTPNKIDITVELEAESSKIAKIQ